MGFQCYKLNKLLILSIFLFFVVMLPAFQHVALADQPLPPKLFFSVLDLGDEVESLQEQKDDRAKADSGKKMTQLAMSMSALVGIGDWQPTEEDCLDLEEHVLPVCLEALTNAEGGERQNALRIILSIGNVRDRAKLPPLENLEILLTNTLQREADHETRNLVVRVLQSIGVSSIGTLNEVVAAATNQQHDMAFLRDAFILVAENAENTPGALDLLIEYSRHDAIPVQRAALRAIYKSPVASDAIVQRLFDALRSPDFPVRQAAVFALQGNSVSQQMSVRDLNAIADESKDESQDMGVRRGCLTVLAVAAQFKHRVECEKLLMAIVHDKSQSQELRSDAVGNFAMIANLEAEHILALKKIASQEEGNAVGASSKKVLDYLEAEKRPAASKSGRVSKRIIEQR